MMIPTLLAGLCDDAALFPPGNALLEDAAPAHIAHENSRHAGIVGPFVFPASRLDELSAAATSVDGVLELTLTVPAGVSAVPAAVQIVRGIDGVRLAALEIAVPDGQRTAELITALDEIARTVPGVDVFVEVPRDDRRPEIMAALIGTPYSVKFRTGGIVAEAYPDEAELAAAISAVVGSGVPFKATAGLHHAVRNTDPDTGFEQHGFLNLMLATHRAAQGADTDVVVATLADRDGRRIADTLSALDDDEVGALRATFRSFGTCSISDPLTELADLGLLSMNDPTSLSDPGVTA
ncbi:hypothetical protein [Gordonia liuliyuniae]|uniref:Uncharacterized protein n=1 Tax=Gordonia liuliyuniae TaxID=2911517 RepID=A0ABS9ITX0_9ACTN|nr:hypothetical protein [Gordonia liuliyuniae]MCF8589008.1 hypothetical protein [Gordonia liuliyuniae]